MGHYAARGRFVELFLCDGNTAPQKQYRGLYVVLEKIKLDKHRVKVMAKQGELGEQTGYILKIDWLNASSDEYYFKTNQGIRVISVYPKSEDISDEQKTYIKSYINDFEASLFQNYRSELHGSYNDYIDVDSFIDFMIIAELSKNVDTFRKSTYMHKDRTGKLKMGPVWDFNQAYGNSVYHRYSINPEGWLLDHHYPWVKGLLRNAAVGEKYVTRWRELRSSVLSDDALLHFISSNAALLEEARQRNFSRWRILGKYVLGNPRPYPKTYRGEVARLNNWLLTRIRWLDENLGSRFGIAPPPPRERGM